MVRTRKAESWPADAAMRAGTTARAVGARLLAIASPDLFGVSDTAVERRHAAVRRRLARSRIRTAALALLAEPWRIGETLDPPQAVALARRYLRRHPERDRPDPAQPLLTERQAAAEWHAEEAEAERHVEHDEW